MRVPINRLEPVWGKSASGSENASASKTSWRGTAQAWEESLESLLSKHPKTAIAAAAAAGVLLGWMVKRR